MSSTWIFGYGSLIFRPAFRATQRRPGLIRGYARRFWQGSTDHRGTPDAPGRVVTLIDDPAAVCWGVAYELPAEQTESIVGALDVREQGGYVRRDVAVELQDGSEVRAITYYAGAGNPNYIGEAPLSEIAAVARVAVGPSGPNREYVLALARSLEQMGVSDDHVSELAALL